MKIIWIDGTFGSGKTAVANVIAKRINNKIFARKASEELKDGLGKVEIGEKYKKDVQDAFQ